MSYLENHGRPREDIIHAGNVWKYINPLVAGERKAHGLMPRNLTTHPPGCYAWAAPPTFALIPRSEWSARCAEKTAQKSWLSDVRMTGGPNGQMIPALDQNGRGYCFPPGTRIRMADGSVKNIEAVRLLNDVLTAEGNVRRVMQCHARELDGEMVTVKMWGHGHLRLTPNHEVLTRRGYVPAGDLIADDWVAIPRRLGQHGAGVIQTAEHVRGVKRRLARVKGAETWEVRQPQQGDKSCKPIPDFIALTPKAGRLFGLWLAEGHIDASTNSVIWSFGAHETETLAAEVVELLREEWGIEARMQPGPGPNVTQVILQGVLWAQMFDSLCGRLAGAKRAHADLMGGPTDFLEAMFWGWMAGDGCERVTARRAPFRIGATVSHDLALNMFDIANALGLCPSINMEKPQQNKYAKVRRPVWKVKVIPKPSNRRPNYRMQVENGCMWRKVHGLEREAYKGTVYNLGVEGDNSYVAEGVGVHNCWMHSGPSCMLLVRAKQGLPFIDISPYACACVIKSFADEGGWGAQGVDFLVEKGIPTADKWPQQATDRKYDTPETWANAALHKVTMQWADLSQAQYDRNLSFDQHATLWLSDCPTVTDFNFWSHSVSGIDLVDGATMRSYSRDESGKLMSLVEFDLVWGMNESLTSGFSMRLLNSWGNSWSSNGTGILTGSHAIPDGGVGVSTVSFAS